MIRFMTPAITAMMCGWAAATIWGLKGGSRRAAFFGGALLGFIGLAYTILATPQEALPDEVTA